MSSIPEQTKAIIAAELDVDTATLTDNANFIFDLGADSVEILNMVVEFENEFKILISDDELIDFKTVGQVIAFLQHKVAIKSV